MGRSLADVGLNMTVPSANPTVFDVIVAYPETAIAPLIDATG